MRLLALAAFATLSAAQARADIVADARSATGACLSAVIDGAPVGDIDEDAISIRRGLDPVSCTVTVRDGAPVVVREAALAAITRRGELFAPAKTRWDPEAFASRETFCNTSLRRSLNVAVSTSKPGQQPVLVVTIFEAAQRDPRCDRDEGLQKLADVTTPARSAAPTIQELPAKPAKAKRRLLPWLPDIGGRKD